MAKKTDKPPEYPPLPTIDSPEVAAMTDVGARTDYIADLMRVLRFWRGKTGRQLAKVWGVSASTVRGYSAVASRMVKSEVTDRDEVERDINAVLAWAIRSAVEKGNVRDAVAAAKVAAEVSGVKAAERHEVVTTEATPERARRLIEEEYGSRVTPKGDSDGVAASE